MTGRPMVTLGGVQVLVPYVAMWSSERGSYAIRPCKHANGRMAVFATSGGYGQGRPVLGKMSETRQREVVARRLCQVCREPLLGGCGYALEPPHGTCRIGLVPFPLMLEPLACERCARLALAHCPGVRRFMSDPAYAVLRVTRYEPVAQLIGPDGSGDEVDQALAAYQGDEPPVGYLKLALTAFSRVAPTDLLTRAA